LRRLQKHGERGCQSALREHGGLIWVAGVKLGRGVSSSGEIWKSFHLVKEGGEGLLVVGAQIPSAGPGITARVGGEKFVRIFVDVGETEAVFKSFITLLPATWIGKKRI